MSSSAALIVSFFLGIVGFAYLTYGWKQKHIMATVSGIGMSVLPLLVADPIVCSVVGVVFIALPWMLRF